MTALWYGSAVFLEGELFAGAVVVEAMDRREAETEVVRVLVASFGEAYLEILVVKIPPSVVQPSPEFRGRVLQKDEVNKFWPDAKSIGEWKAEGREVGVAGDRCGNGNECGRVGCPECQQ